MNLGTANTELSDMVTDVRQELIESGLPVAVIDPDDTLLRMAMYEAAKEVNDDLKDNPDRETVSVTIEQTDAKICSEELGLFNTVKATIRNALYEMYVQKISH